MSSLNLSFWTYVHCLSSSRYWALWRAWLCLRDDLPGSSLRAAVRFPWSHLFFPKWNKRQSFSLPSQGNCSCPNRLGDHLLNPLQIVGLFCIEGNKTGHRRGLMNAEWRGIIPPFLLFPLLLTQPRLLLTSFAVRARCWLTFSLLPVPSPLGRAAPQPARLLAILVIHRDKVHPWTSSFVCLCRFTFNYQVVVPSINTVDEEEFSVSYKNIYSSVPFLQAQSVPGRPLNFRKRDRNFNTKNVTFCERGY